MNGKLRISSSDYVGFQCNSEAFVQVLEYTETSLESALKSSVIC